MEPSYHDRLPDHLKTKVDQFGSLIRSGISYDEALIRSDLESVEVTDYMRQYGGFRNRVQDAYGELRQTAQAEQDTIINQLCRYLVFEGLTFEEALRAVDLDKFTFSIWMSVYPEINQKVTKAYNQRFENIEILQKSAERQAQVYRDQIVYELCSLTNEGTPLPEALAILGFNSSIFLAWMREYDYLITKFMTGFNMQEASVTSQPDLEARKNQPVARLSCNLDLYEEMNINEMIDNFLAETQTNRPISEALEQVDLNQKIYFKYQCIPADESLLRIACLMHSRRALGLREASHQKRYQDLHQLEAFMVAGVPPEEALERQNLDLTILNLWRWLYPNFHQKSKHLHKYFDFYDFYDDLDDINLGETTQEVIDVGMPSFEASKDILIIDDSSQFKLRQQFKNIGAKCLALIYRR